ncbi:MAG: M20/M25/M40 family metallo-hydrolase, partial [Bacteroidales bacterium]|nr:M20/M25/M40 family metallo-hydrolase [Bacteroidales bacterium]
MDAKTVLNYFEQITSIPRESGHEEPMTAFLQQFASGRGLECKVDGIGNVLIIKPASPGREGVPALVLQCHQDMVCEKVPGSRHDFLKDPIRYVIEDGWMIAKETTLGADDGIGIAACLALLDSDLPAGRLECLFTISEETGMDGAEYMQAGFFDGKTLINLDSEDEGQMFIGCAGGLNTTASFGIEYGPVPEGWTTLKVEIGGGIGGHSGDDINKERMNAVQQMARFLYAEKRTGMLLLSICGGGKPNAIARDCEAIIAVPSAQDTIARAEAFDAALKDEFHVTDPAVFAKAGTAPEGQKTLSQSLSDRLVDALFGCPHGVAAMSQDIEGLVETSTNLASVKSDG